MLFNKINNLTLIEKLNFFLRLLLYPIFVLFEIPGSWIKSIYNSRILLEGKWERYMGFIPRTALNNLFYRTQWININKFGRSGVTDFLSFGNYPLSNFFQLSLFSSYIFSNAGAVTIIFGNFVWFSTNFIWLEKINSLWVLIVLVFLFLSSTLYSMTFALQNYQILSWMWMPLSLFHISQGEYISAFFCWIAMSLFGLTQIFWGIPICIYFSIINNSFLPILILVITCLICSLRLLPLLKKKDSFKRIYDMFKIINIKSPKSLYKRDIENTLIVDLYFISIYLLPIIVIWLNERKSPYLLIIGLLIFFINQRIIRIADLQSTIIFMATLLTHTIISYDPNLFNLIAYIIAINPNGILLKIEKLNGKIDIFTPFDNKKIFENIEEFFSPVNKKNKVYASFKDPEEDYGKIFENYTNIYELALTVASKNEFHLFPDWHAVAECNFVGGKKLWSFGSKEVFEKCIEYNAKFAFIHQKKNTILKDEWFENFDLISEFDWSSYINEINSENKNFDKNYYPKWFLLKIKN